MESKATQNNHSSTSAAIEESISTLAGAGESTKPVRKYIKYPYFNGEAGSKDSSGKEGELIEKNSD